MEDQQQPQQDHEYGGDFVLGVVVALLLAIPFWAGIGIAAILVFQERAISRWQGGAFMLAAAIEIFLLRYAWRAYRPKLDLQVLLRRYMGTSTPTIAPALPAAGAFRPTLKRSGLLAGLVAAYLHYYYWDVQLQIASLNHLTVFVPATSLG